MYTSVVQKKQTAPKRYGDTHITDLGRFMRRWRKESGLTVEAAAHKIKVVRSTWSKLENGHTQASTEVLLALSELTGRTVDDLAVMDGRVIVPSPSDDVRGRRAAALAVARPKYAVLIDLLPELTDRETDTLLSVAESLIRSREPGEHQTDGR